MKKLSKDAGISPDKVFPHNLRHLFARRYYEREKDLVRLADYLGHSSVETTRNYTMTSGWKDCQKQLELDFVINKTGKYDWGKKGHNVDYVPVI